MTSLTSTQSHNLRQTLHLSIDPAAYSSSSQSYSESSPSSSETSPTSSISELGFVDTVLCMYDFQSDDPDHLPFRKNEILDIVRKEPTGWWAAMRKEGETVGWIPKAYVESISVAMREKLLNVRTELRVYEYQAEQLYNNAPTSKIPLYDPEPEPTPSPRNYRGSGYCTDPQSQNVSKKLAPDSRYPPPSPSPATPLPLLPSSTNNSSDPKTPCWKVNKPTPPTPTEQDRLPSSTPSNSNPTSKDPRRLPRLMTLTEAAPNHHRDLSSDNSMSTPDSASKRSDEKIKKVMGSEEALPYYNQVLMQAHMPWYLKAKYSHELEYDAEGKLIKGSKRALVEKLVWSPAVKDPIRAAEDTAYRRMFLTTFRTFMSADELFEMLVDQYSTDHPPNLTEAEFVEWKDRSLNQTQRTVLNVFAMWLEEQRLLEEEPTVASPLTAFLNLIKAPHPLSVQAQQIVKTIERLTFAIPSYSLASSPHTKRRKQKDPKGDFLRLDPTDIAQQLSLLEFKAYSKITPQECIRYAKVQTGKEVENLSAFCGMHDKVAAWVTNSVLDNTVLTKRADTVDNWIKVAEKCRTLNNFASMSAIINALSSTVITRLHLTWAHVSRKNTFDNILKLNDPAGGFSAYRSLQINVEGPCVPFVGMYLTDIVHIKDQFTDDPENDRVCFLKRQRWYEVIKIMLRSQQKQYHFPEIGETMNFIVRATSASGSKDWQAKIWNKSQIVQRSEIANADIRRGLEAAGF